MEDKKKKEVYTLRVDLPLIFKPVIAIQSKKWGCTRAETVKRLLAKAFELRISE